MNRKALRFVLFFVLLHSSSSFARCLDIKAAYFSENALLPGVSLGIESAILHSTFHSLNAGLDANAILNLRNYVVFDVEPYIGYRFLLPFGLFFQAQTGAGCIGFIPLAFYLVRNAEGGWDPLSDWGLYAFAGHLSIGIGWDFSKMTVLPVSLHIEVRLIAQYPHLNGLILFRPVAMVGLRF